MIFLANKPKRQSKAKASKQKERHQAGEREEGVYKASNNESRVARKSP